MTPEPESVKKVAMSMPVSADMLADTPIDWFNLPIHPQSLLDAVSQRVADAEEELEAAEERLDDARAEYERVKAVPGSDVVHGEARSLNEMLVDWAGDAR